MIVQSCQNLMFPHPGRLVGDIYNTAFEFIAIYLEQNPSDPGKKTKTTSLWTPTHTYTVLNTKLHSALYTVLYTVLYNVL